MIFEINIFDKKVNYLFITHLKNANKHKFVLSTGWHTEEVSTGREPHQGIHADT